jgi:hypothetical protein
MNVNQTRPIAYPVYTPAIRHYGHTLVESSGMDNPVPEDLSLQYPNKTIASGLDEISSQPPVIWNDSQVNSGTSALKTDGSSGNAYVAMAASLYALNKSYEEQEQILNLLA